MVTKQNVTIELEHSSDNVLKFSSNKFYSFKLKQIIQGKDLVNFFKELNKFDISDFSNRDWECIVYIIGELPHTYKFRPVIY